jgi:hypothetical protein
VDLDARKIDFRLVDPAAKPAKPGAAATHRGGQGKAKPLPEAQLATAKKTKPKATRPERVAVKRNPETKKLARKSSRKKN